MTGGAQLQRIEALIRAGRTEEARRHCERLLKRHPRDDDLALALVRMSYEASAYELTVVLCDWAIERKRDAVAALLFRGIAYLALGRNELALASFDQGLGFHPDAWELLMNRGIALDRLRRIDEAIQSYERVIAINPRYADAFNNLANALQTSGRDSEAVAKYNDALTLNPGHVIALYNRSVVLNRLGRFRDALRDFDTLLRIQPDFAQALSDRSISLAFLGRLDEALASCDRALALSPQYPQARANRGTVLNLIGRFEEALNDLEDAQAALGDTAELLSGRACALRGMGQLESALTWYERVITSYPKAVQSFVDRGVLLTDLGRPDAARESFDAAIRLDSDCAEAHFSKSLLELEYGNMLTGWKEYEYRWKRRGAEPRTFTTYPPWQGEQLANGQRLLVWGEQGVGDEIVFSSMYAQLAFLGERCVIECRAKLASLFRRAFPWATLVVRDAALAPEVGASIAYQVPAGSLGQHFRRDLKSFPMHRGYLIADPRRVEHWRERLGGLGDGFKIGFCWRSSNVVGDRGHSCTRLDEWGPLFAIPSVHWICLQYDDCGSELEAARSRFAVTLHRFDGVDYYDDLDEVAALMKSLDLVISAPTSVGLQSAALGVPTWMLSYGPEWQTHGTQGFPWLPAIVRFNRRWDERWAIVIEQVAARLRKESQGGS